MLYNWKQLFFSWTSGAVVRLVLVNPAINAISKRCFFCHEKDQNVPLLNNGAGPSEYCQLRSCTSTRRRLTRYLLWILQMKLSWVVAVNPGGARWGRSLLISAPNLDPLLRLGRISSQSPRGPLGGHACVHTANSDWQQYIISSFRMTVILRREMSGCSNAVYCENIQLEPLIKTWAVSSSIIV